MLQVTIILEFFLLLLSILLCIFAFTLSLSFLFGAPFLTTPKSIVNEIIKLSEIKATDTFMDIGSGDGRLIIAAAKVCRKSVGYEINPFLVFYSRLTVFMNRVNNNTNVHFQNYLNGDMSGADVITLYGIRSHIPQIEIKLNRELKKGTKIISYKFELSGFHHVKTIKSNIFLYEVI